MRGHDYIRTVIRDHLSASVPLRLAALRQADSVDTPHDPSAASYILADGLPTDPNLYPCLVVMSTSSPTMRQVTAIGHGEAGDFVVGYTLTVVVACRVDESGSWEQASSDRDRLLLAVREAILAPAPLPEDVDLIRDNLTEDVGAAAQDLRGRPLAAGQVNFSATVVETLHPLPAVAAIENSNVELSETA